MCSLLVRKFSLGSRCLTEWQTNSSWLYAVETSVYLLCVRHQGGQRCRCRVVSREVRVLTLCIIVSGGFDCPGVGLGCPAAALSLSEEWNLAAKGWGGPGFGLDLVPVLFPLGGPGCLLPSRRSPENRVDEAPPWEKLRSRRPGSAIHPPAPAD